MTDSGTSAPPAMASAPPATGCSPPPPPPPAMASAPPAMAPAMGAPEEQLEQRGQRQRQRRPAGADTRDRGWLGFRVQRRCRHQPRSLLLRRRAHQRRRQRHRRRLRAARLLRSRRRARRRRRVNTVSTPKSSAPRLRRNSLKPSTARGRQPGVAGTAPSPYARRPSTSPPAAMTRLQKGLGRGERRQNN